MPKSALDSKNRVLRELQVAFPMDLSIKEIAEKSGLCSPTVSTWLKVAEAERKIEQSRKVGNAKFYRLKKVGGDRQ